jgi:hypothetical protein
MLTATLADRLARFNRRLPNRVIGTIAGRRLSPVAFMVHQGRSSGRQYRTPVLPLPLADPRLLDAAGAAPQLPAPLRPALRVVPGIRFLRLSAR